MGKAAGELYAKLALKIDEFEKNAHKSKEIAEKLGRDIDGIVDEINEKLKQIGVGLSAGVTLPLTLFGKQAEETFSSYQQSMQNTFSVMGATASEMEALKQKAEEMGASTRFSASQAADALDKLGSAGQNAGEAMNSLDGVLSLAGATRSDLAFTSETITSTLSQFNLTADKAAHIADVYATAISKSQANMTKLSYSMKYVGPVASGLNVSLETATAALMRLYNTGFGGEQAGTILRSGLQKLASGTDELKGKLQALGIQYDDVNPKTNSLADIIDRLKTAQVGVTEANDLFGEAAAAGMQKLIEGGGEALRTMDGLLQASDGAAEKMQEIQNASFANTKAELASAWEAVQITLTSNVIPAVDTFTKGITAVLKTINDMPVGLQIAGQGFAAIAASAGPLLLVAANVTKIKAAWATLNAVMAANPIFIWAAGIAAAGAVAMGIIAQVRKAHEDYIHGAKKGVEEVKKLQEDAQKSGDEGRKIQSLFAEYKNLKDNMKGAADEQERYNLLLTQLKELVPGVTEKLNEHGDAVITNEEKITQAIQNKLEREKVLNDMALTQARIRKKQAEIVAKTYKDEGERINEALIKKEDYITRLDAFYNKIAQFDTALKNNNKAEVEALRKEILQEAHSNGFSIDFAVFQKGDANALKHTEKYLLKQNKELTKIREEYQKILSVQKEQEDALNELNGLTEKAAALNKALNDINSPIEPPEKKTRQTYADEKLKEYEQRKKQIADEKEQAELLQETYDDVGKRMEFLREKIKELKGLSEQELLDGLFTTHSAELKPFYDELQRLAQLQESKKKSGNKADGKKDTTMQDEIEAFDKVWRERISKAKEYGKDSVELEKKYLEERKALIDKFVNDVKTAEKKKKENAGLSDVQLLEKAKSTETAKDSGVTLADEYTKTARMGLGAFAKYKEQMSATRSELEKLQIEIQNTQNMIESGQDASGNALSDTDKADAEQYLKQMQEKAAALRLELIGSKVSLSDIENTLTNLNNAGKSEFQLKLINIEAERKRIHEVLDAAVTAGKISDDEAKKRKDKADKQAAKDTKKAAVETANFYIQGVMNIGQTLAGVIAGAIEQGGLDGLAALQAGGQILNQIGNMVGDPIAKAVIGAVSGAIGIISTLIKAVDNKVKKENEARRQAVEAEWNSYLEKVDAKAKDVFNSLARQISNVNTGGLNWNEIFRLADLKSAEKKIEDFKNSLEDLTTSEYTVKRWTETKRATFGEWITGQTGGKIWYDVERAEKEYKTIKVLQAELIEARKKGDEAEATRLEKIIKDTVYAAAKNKGINIEDIDGIKNYVQGFDTALASYIKTGDMKQFKKAMKDALYEAVVQKAVFNSMLTKIQADLNKVEQGEMSMAEFETNLEAMGEKAREHAVKLAALFGIPIDKDSLAAEWKQIGEGMTSALSSALGDAAYNADWGAFKKSFAAEMKKAIIHSAMQSTGMKAKVDEIIKGIMADGKVTAEEVKNGVEKLKPFFDTIEKMTSEAATAAKALEGGVEIKAQAAGTIIQQLSGADRDVLLEAIKNGFKTINQSIDLKDATIQHLAATQIIINAVTFHSHNGTVYIQANETTDLKALISEIVEKSLAG